MEDRGWRKEETLEERIKAKREDYELTTVSEMSSRIDNLETAISDLMQGGEPPSPSPAQKRH